MLYTSCVGNFAKGEAFREVWDGMSYAKVRKFGIVMGAAGGKSPSDGGSRGDVYPGSDPKGEVFREYRSEDRSSVAVRKSGER